MQKNYLTIKTKGSNEIDIKNQDLFAILQEFKMKKKQIILLKASS